MTNRSRFCFNNWLADSDFDVSSAQASYPGSNLVHSIRSRVWKANGLFEITATNNTVYVDATSFTIPVGSYSFSTLVTAFGVASGGLSLTLSRNGANKMVITSGSSVTYKLSTSTNAIWSTLGFISTTDVTATTATADQAAYHTSEWIKVDLGIAQECTFAALIPANGQAFTLSPSATVKLQGNNVDLWTSPNYDVDMELDFRGAFLAPTDAGSHRYWRIKIVDPTNSDVQAAVCYIGDSYIPTNTNIATGFSRSSVDLSIRSYSEAGALFVDERPKVLQLSSMQMQFLKDDDLYDAEQLIYDLGVNEAFFICLDPGTNVSSTLSKMTHYVALDGPAQFQHVIGGYYNTSFNLREII